MDHIIIDKNLTCYIGPQNYFDLDVFVGYEPAGLTVHPPPQNDRGWVHFFRMGV